VRSRRAGDRGVAPRTCADVIALLTEYLEGGLSRAERAALETHLAGCVACAEYVRSLKLTSSAVSRLRGDAIPDELRDRLRSFLRLRLSTPGA
jgi:anti-sigma factor RsiW